MQKPIVALRIRTNMALIQSQASCFTIAFKPAEEDAGLHWILEEIQKGIEEVLAKPLGELAFLEATRKCIEGRHCNGIMLPAICKRMLKEHLVALRHNPQRQKASIRASRNSIQTKK